MRQYIGFKLNDSEFTLPILKVREIINTPVITRLPQSPHYVRGVINLRGRIIPVLDLKELVSMSGAEGGGAKIIVITKGNMVFGILVDEITSVINIDDASIEPPESFLQDNLERVEGVARFDDRLVILLDTDKLVETQDIDMFEEAITSFSGGRAALRGHGTRAIESGATIEAMRPPPVETAEAPVLEESAPKRDALEGKDLHGVKDVLKQKYGDNVEKRRFVSRVVDLIDALATHNYDRAEVMINEMLQTSDDSLFREVGMVTRKLHDSLREFKNALDPRIKQIADEEVPTAVDSLEYVITKTEDAANRTMGIVEKYQQDLGDFSSQLGKIKNPKKAVEYLNEFKASLNKDLTEIMLAQEFQDITGQTIRKVIELVNAIEAELVGLITTFGVKADAGKKEIKLAQKISQDAVDELLKEFGF